MNLFIAFDNFSEKRRMGRKKKISEDANAEQQTLGGGGDAAYSDNK